MAKSAGNITITVSVDCDDSIGWMKKLYEDIAELYDMVPEYRQYEADKVIESIKNRTGELLISKRKN